MMMTQRQPVIRPILTPLLFKRMGLGAGIALLIIAAFVLPVQGRPEWGAYWKVRPFIITPMAGALGGFCYYLLDNITLERGWNPIWTNMLSMLIFVVGLWMGIVLGLVGTLWN